MRKNIKHENVIGTHGLMSITMSHVMRKHKTREYNRKTWVNLHNYESRDEKT